MAVSSSQVIMRVRPAAVLALDGLAMRAAALPELQQAVASVLRRLARDPFSKRLGTTLYATPQLGGLCATPVHVDDWYVFWQRGTDPGTVDVTLIHPLPARCRG